jgi:hypothetical protein
MLALSLWGASCFEAEIKPIEPEPANTGGGSKRRKAKHALLFETLFTVAHSIVLERAHENCYLNSGNVPDHDGK